VHELGHETCAFNDKNDEMFGGKEVREEAKDHAYAIAQQADITNIPLNEYHRQLLDQMRSGEISVGRYFRETHAIMLEMRITDNQKLLEVQKRQKRAFETAKISDSRLKDLDFTPITGVDINGKAIGVDRTLIALIGGVENLEQLNEHLDNVHQFSSENPNPFKV